jgi:RNA polymerase sigma-B factor
MSETQSRSDSAEALVREYLVSQNPRLRDSIIEACREMVERIARKYAGLEAQEDLVQVGFLGLLNALGMFEPSKGVRFTTYATHLVTGSIKHHLRDRAKIIREPAWLQEIRHKCNRASSQLQHQLGRPPSADEVASATGTPVETVREVIASEDLFRVTSLSPGTTVDDDDTDEFDLADDCRELLSLEDRAVLEKAIGELRDIEQRVLTLFHVECLNQTEIAQRLGISGNYVSHILRQSLTKLRASLAREERLERHMQRQADHLSHDVIDEETDAYSEAHARARLDEECTKAARDGLEVAVVVLRFDGLDALRRFYGADAVRQFLADATVFIRACVRRLDIVGRMGETGFMVILPGTGQSASVVRERLGTRLRSWLRRPEGTAAGVKILIGQSLYPAAGRSAGKLLAAVELASVDLDQAA